MTLDDLRASDKAFLLPREVAMVLKCDPHLVRLEAKDGTLPFPFVRIGTRTKIPRLPFIAWMEGRTGSEN